MQQPPQTRSTANDLIDVACVAVTVAVAVAVATDERNAFRAVVAVAFALYVPGRAVVSNWRSLEERAHVALSVLLSLSILTLLATLTLWAGYWHPTELLEGECVAVGVALFTALLRRRQTDHATTAIAEGAIAEGAITEGAITEHEIVVDPPRRDRLWNGHLIRNAAALMLSSGGTSILGIAFWTTAAHLSTAGNVGRASAEITAMIFLANIAQLSFGSIFYRFLPVMSTGTLRFVTRAYALCAGVAFIAAIVYLAAGFGKSIIPSSLGSRVLFVVVVVLWTIFVLQDTALTGLRETRWVPVENILFALAKLALLPAFLVVTTQQGLFLAWSVPVVGAVGGVTWFLFRKKIPAHELLPGSTEKPPTIREMISLASAQYATSLLSVFTPSIVVLILIRRLGPVDEAYFYVPALITSGAGLLVWNLVTSFLVEGASNPKELRAHANVTIRATIAIVVPIVLFGAIWAPEILRIFGANYATHGTTLLRMLLFSLPGTAITAFYYSLAWLDRRLWWLAVRELASAIVYFSILLALISRIGILAAGIASLVSNGLQGLFFLPISMKRYRSIPRSDAVDKEGTGVPVLES
jgi:O-antigen/teichoic acid export membrane protein